MQCVLHDGKGGTCPLAEDLIITYTGKKTRRDGSLKRYVTYYITSHPELKWLTEIALGGFQLLDLIITELKSHMTC